MSVKCKSVLIRKELCYRMSPLPRLVVSSHSGNAHQSAGHHISAAGEAPSAMDENLLMFREALAISGKLRACLQIMFIVISYLLCNVVH